VKRYGLNYLSRSDFRLAGNWYNVISWSNLPHSYEHYTLQNLDLFLDGGNYNDYLKLMHRQTKLGRYLAGEEIEKVAE
jgi:hypothetical protein